MKVPNSTVCIVDDDDSVRESLDGLLKSIGFSVATFDSAESFLEADLCPSAACLLLDVRMSGMNGLELQRKLSRRGCAVPIVFITAHADPLLTSRAIQAGAIAVLAKPFSDEDLLAGIETALKAT